uniref:Uncharacterized protein n=1 Tax=Arundo donax TaxID=35708 RepID=A0A0A9H2I7_ARUDO
MCSCLSESSKANTLSLRASVRAGANGALCINHVLAPLIDSLVPLRLPSTSCSSAATSVGSGPERPLKDCAAVSYSPCP